MLEFDYYKMLGITPAASQEEIKKAYREKVRKYHPDLHKAEPEAPKKMAEVNEAYETLSDPAKRSLYDEKTTAPRYVNFTPSQQPTNSRVAGEFEGEELRDIFDSLFESFGKQGGAKTARVPFTEKAFNFTERRTNIKPEQVPALEKKLTLTETEARLGTKKDIKVERYEECEVCEGRGIVWGAEGLKRCPVCQGKGRQKKLRILTVQVPGKLKTGMRVHIAGQGNIGLNTQIRGALYLLITVKATKQKQEVKITEALSGVKALEKSYKQLARKFASKTFLAKTQKFVGPTWLAVGKLYVKYTTGALAQELKIWQIEGQALKQIPPEQLTEPLRIFKEKLAIDQAILQAGLTALQASEKIPTEKLQN